MIGHRPTTASYDRGAERSLGSRELEAGEIVNPRQYREARC